MYWLLRPSSGSVTGGLEGADIRVVDAMAETRVVEVPDPVASTDGFGILVVAKTLSLVLVLLTNVSAFMLADA